MAEVAISTMKGPIAGLGGEFDAGIIWQGWSRLRRASPPYLPKKMSERSIR
jgi:hypothetical protein